MLDITGSLAPPAEEEGPRTRAQIESALLRPLARRWNSRIKKAQKKREPWESRAKECKAFYQCAADLIWNGDRDQRIAPLMERTDSKFRFVLGKAFEFVAVFGPSLFYTVPHRRVTPRQMPQEVGEVIEQMLAPYRQQQQMQAQMAMQQGMPPMPPVPHPLETMLQQDRQRFAAQGATARLMESWLNYTPLEQPGTLSLHGKHATIDAMLTGRGVLAARVHRKPSGRLVTGLFRVDPMHFLVDPDFPAYQDAGWVAVKRIEPYADVEGKFGLAPGTLKKKASREGSYGGSYDDGLTDRDIDDPTDKTLFCYWEIFSKRGVGLDSPDENPPADVRLALELSQTVGRYAYLAIAPGIEYPLNAHPDLFVGSEQFAPATPETVGQMFAWPFETWRDDRFPFEVLDFYPDPESPWPIAPLTPGMGELKFMNYMMSRLANRIDSSCRDFIAAASAYYDDVKEVLDKGEDLALMRVSGGQKVSDLVGFLQQPQVNFDAWKILDAVSHLFEQRTGLNDLAYGGNPGGTQSRTAADAANKREATMIRPQYMQQTVEEWFSRASGLEAMNARRYVEPQEVAAVMGQASGFLWQQFVASQDMNAIAGEYEYRVDAGSMRRPNKEQLVANLNQLGPVMLPFLQGYAQQTGNVGPLNNFLLALGDSIDQDMHGILIPPPPPQPMPQGPPAEEPAPPQEQAA